MNITSKEFFIKYLILFVAFLFFSLISLSKVIRDEAKKSEKTKICEICKLEINLHKENYVRLTDYKEGKFFTEGFYHNSCYNQLINEKKSAILDKAEHLLRYAGKLTGIKDKKEFIVNDESIKLSK